MAYEELIKALNRCVLAKAEKTVLPHQCHLFNKETRQHLGPTPETVKHWKYDGKYPMKHGEWANAHCYTCRTCGDSKTWFGDRIKEPTESESPE